MKYSKHKYIFIISLLGTFIVLLWHIKYYWYFTIDDAYISFRYAKNWVAGYGLVYNIGERVEGYTNFLWIVLIALFMKIHLLPPISAKILGIILLGYSLYLTYQISRHLTGSNTHSIPWSIVLCTTYPHLIVASLEGLETPLFTTLILILFYMLIKNNVKISFIIIIGCILSCLAMTRPDGILFIIPTILIIYKISPTRIKVKAIQILIIVFIITYGSYFLWRLYYYHQLLPNTFYAKQMATGYLIIRGFKSLNKFFFDQILSITILTIITIMLNWRNHVIQWLIGFILARIIFVLLSGEAWMGYYRFCTPILPLLVILSSYTLNLILLQYSEIQRPKRYIYLLIIIVTLLHPISKSIKHHKMATLYATGLTQAHIRLGIDLQKYAPKGAILACADAGALPYYSNLPTIDIMGLTDRHIAHLPGRHWEKTDPYYILARKPTFIVLNSKTPPPSFNAITAAFKSIYQQHHFQINYHLWKIYRFHDQYFLWVFIRNDTILKIQKHKMR